MAREGKFQSVAAPKKLDSRQPIKFRASATVGEALRVTLVRRNISQRAAGESIGVNQERVSIWSNEKEEPGGRWLPAIRQFLEGQNVFEKGAEEDAFLRLVYWGRLHFDIERLERDVQRLKDADEGD